MSLSFKKNQLIFSLSALVMAFTCTANIKPVPVSILSCIVPISIALMCSKRGYLRVPGILIFAALLFLITFIGSSVALYEFFPAKAVSDPVMILLTWREIVSVILALILVLFFFVLIRKKPEKRFLLLLGVGSLTGLLLGLFLN